MYKIRTYMYKYVHTYYINFDEYVLIIIYVYSGLSIIFLCSVLKFLNLKESKTNHIIFGTFVVCLQLLLLPSMVVQIDFFQLVN